MVIRQCRECGYLGLPKEFRLRNRRCRKCENRYRARYHKAHREQCIQASVRSNRVWRARSFENLLMTRHWNRVAYRNRTARLSASHYRSMPT